MTASFARRGIHISVPGLSFVLGTNAIVPAPRDLADRIADAALTQKLSSVGVVTLLKETCCTRFNLGILATAVAVALLILLIPAHKGGAMLGLPKGSGTPADFADLAVEEPADPIPAAENNPSPSPEPPAPVPAVAKPIAVLTLLQTNSAVPLGPPPMTNRVSLTPLTAPPIPYGAWPNAAPANSGYANAAAGAWGGQQVGAGIHVTTQTGGPNKPDTTLQNNTGQKSISPVTLTIPGVAVAPTAVSQNPPASLATGHPPVTTQSNGRRRQR